MLATPHTHLHLSTHCTVQHAYFPNSTDTIIRAKEFGNFRDEKECCQLS